MSFSSSHSGAQCLGSLRLARICLQELCLAYIYCGALHCHVSGSPINPKFKFLKCWSVQNMPRVKEVLVAWSREQLGHFVPQMNSAHMWHATGFKLCGQLYAVVVIFDCCKRFLHNSIKWNDFFKQTFFVVEIKPGASGIPGKAVPLGTPQPSFPGYTTAIFPWVHHSNLYTFYFEKVVQVVLDLTLCSPGYLEFSVLSLWSNWDYTSRKPG